MDQMKEMVKKMLLSSLKGEKRNELKEPFGKKMKTMKVSVVAKDPKDMEEGLSKAKELLSKRKEMFGMPSEMPEMDQECEMGSECQGEGCPMCGMDNESGEEQMDTPEHESSEAPSFESEEGSTEGMSEQDKIKELQQKIADLKRKSK